MHRRGTRVWTSTPGLRGNFKTNTTYNRSTRRIAIKRYRRKKHWKNSSYGVGVLDHVFCTDCPIKIARVQHWTEGIYVRVITRKPGEKRNRKGGYGMKYFWSRRGDENFGSWLGKKKDIDYRGVGREGLRDGGQASSRVCEKGQKLGWTCLRKRRGKRKEGIIKKFICPLL